MFTLHNTDIINQLTATFSLCLTALCQEKKVQPQIVEILEMSPGGEDFDCNPVISRISNMLVPHLRTAYFGL